MHGSRFSVNITITTWPQLVQPFNGTTFVLYQQNIIQVWLLNKLVEYKDFILDQYSETSILWFLLHKIAWNALLMQYFYAFADLIIMPKL